MKNLSGFDKKSLKHYWYNKIAAKTFNYKNINDNKNENDTSVVGELFIKLKNNESLENDEIEEFIALQNTLEIV
jgi:hypothetical protein